MGACWLRLALKRSDTDPSGQHQSRAHNSSCSRDDKKPLKAKGYCSRLTANDKSWLWNAVRPICPSPLLTRCDINSVSKCMMTVLKAANTIGPRPIFFFKDFPFSRSQRQRLGRKTCENLALF